MWRRTLIAPTRPPGRSVRHSACASLPRGDGSLGTEESAVHVSDRSAARRDALIFQGDSRGGGARARGMPPCAGTDGHVGVPEAARPERPRTPRGRHITMTDPTAPAAASGATRALRGFGATRRQPHRGPRLAPAARAATEFDVRLTACTMFSDWKANADCDMKV